MYKSTDTKIIVSGSTLEVYTYLDNRVVYGFIIPEQYRKAKPKIIVVDEKSRLRKIESRKKGMHRARSNLRRLINANAWKWKKTATTLYLPVFVTLTHTENVQDIKTSSILFSKFIKRLNYHIGEDKKSFLKYVAVTEFQERGAIHYHTIFFNLEFIWKKDLAKLWEQGHIKIRSIKNVSNTGAYVCKYMSKEFEDERLDGKKRYFSSRGLNKPLVINNERRAKKILSRIPKNMIPKESEYDSHIGRVKYAQYQIDKKGSFRHIIPELYPPSCSP